MDRYKITFETWNKIASLYQDKFMTLDLYDDSYDAFCEQLKQSNPVILEIGCGPGNITKYLLAKRPDFNLQGIDIASNMIKLAKVNNPSASFKIMDCRAIDRMTEKYDGIMCGFCMPYLSKEDSSKLIKDCNDLLHPGGIFYFSTIEGDYQKSGYKAGSSGEKTYVYYHEEHYLRKALKENNFKLIKIIRKNYPMNNNAKQVHLIIIAKK